MKGPATALARCLLAAVLTAAAPAHADATLRNATQLRFAVKSSPPCCVIDARSETARGQHPLAEALPYREGMKIVPTATVVVVADSDAQALAVARRIAAAHPGKVVVAVEGGVTAWESVLAPDASDPPGGRALGFVIPKNTCEQGTPLQHLRTEPQ